jgi:hypothetical protein
VKKKQSKLSPLIAARVIRDIVPADQDAECATPVLRLAQGNEHAPHRTTARVAPDAVTQGRQLLEKLWELLSHARLDASGRTDSMPLLQSCIDKTCDAFLELLTARSPRRLHHPRLQKLAWLRTGGACSLRRSSVESACRILTAAMEALDSPQAAGGEDEPAHRRGDEDERAVIRENLNAAASAVNDADFAPATARLTRLDALSAGRNQFSRRPKRE